MGHTSSSRETIPSSAAVARLTFSDTEGLTLKKAVSKCFTPTQHGSDEQAASCCCCCVSEEEEERTISSLRAAADASLTRAARSAPLCTCVCVCMRGREREIKVCDYS